MTLEERYKDLHSHPELAFAEHRSAGIAAEWLAGAGYTVTAGIGGTGVAGVLRNGDGPAVLVRADMDALPLREETGLDYASDVVAADARGERTHVMHACGRRLAGTAPARVRLAGLAVQRDLEPDGLAVLGWP
jgi:metal-dependent amidase/aminoacylase/carboxypeptidase family protein